MAGPGNPLVIQAPSVRVFDPSRSLVVAAAQTNAAQVCVRRTMPMHTWNPERFRAALSALLAIDPASLAALSARDQLALVLNAFTHVAEAYNALNVRARLCSQYCVTWALWVFQTLGDDYSHWADVVHHVAAPGPHPPDYMVAMPGAIETASVPTQGGTFTGVATAGNPEDPGTPLVPELGAVVYLDAQNRVQYPGLADADGNPLNATQGEAVLDSRGGFPSADPRTDALVVKPALAAWLGLALALGQALNRAAPIDVISGAYDGATWLNSQVLDEIDFGAPELRQAMADDPSITPEALRDQAHVLDAALQAQAAQGAQHLSDEVFAGASIAAGAAFGPAGGAAVAAVGTAFHALEGILPWATQGFTEWDFGPFPTLVTAAITPAAPGSPLCSDVETPPEARRPLNLSTGSGSTAAWVVGGAAAVGLVWLLTRKKGRRR